MDEEIDVKRSKKRKSLKRKWRPVAIDGASFLSGGDMEGFVSLEELVDYDINELCTDIPVEEDQQIQTSSVEQTPSIEKKKRKKKKKKKKPKETLKPEDAVSEKAKLPDESSSVNDENSETISIDMKNWTGLGVPSSVLRALNELKFDAPTPIQSLALPAAIHYNKDVVGAAETGSGKTLAFGIPLLHRIMAVKETLKTNSENEQHSETQSANSEEIVSMDDQEEHKQTEVKESSDVKEEIIIPKQKGKRRKKGKKLDPETSLDEKDKQQNISENTTSAVPAKSSLSSNGNPLLALILTPTRELALQVKNHLQAVAKYSGIKITAIVGGMAQQKQLRLLHQHPEVIVATPGRLWELITEGEDHVCRLDLVKVLVLDEADRMVEEGHYAELTSILDMLDKKPLGVQVSSMFDGLPARQSFVFSATLTLTREEETKKHFKQKQKAKPKKKQGLDLLMEKVNFRGKPMVVDLTSKQATAQTLQEARITCNTEDKDVYLYYFLLKYTGRTLVFVNTIDSGRRLVSILHLLGRSPLPLHASMQQRQRLKNLDRFRSSSDGLLIATDVAARGLDIPNVQHVIHYQVPSNPEVYVHRSGRTARISQEGLSVVLVGPDDLKSYRGIIKRLNRDEDLPTFPVEISYLSAVRKRVSVARQIDKEENKEKKMKSSNSWFVNNAKAMDIELDEDLLEDLGDSKERRAQNRKLQQLKANLAELLRTEVVPAGFSGKYPTQAGRLVIPGIPGAGLTNADNEVMAAQVIKKKRKKVA